jgi:hypothetical protein
VSLDVGVEVDDYSSTLNFGSKFSESKLAAVACMKSECCALLAGADDSISFVNVPGKVQAYLVIAYFSHCLNKITGQLVWSREEALSSIINVEMLDLPVSDLDAEIEKEFGTKQGNVLMNEYILIIY